MGVPHRAVGLTSHETTTNVKILGGFGSQVVRNPKKEMVQKSHAWMDHGGGGQILPPKNGERSLLFCVSHSANGQPLNFRGLLIFNRKNRSFNTFMSSHTIHVLYIYLRLVDFYDKCRYIYQSHASYGYGPKWLQWGIRDSLTRLVEQLRILRARPCKWDHLQKRYTQEN